MTKNRFTLILIIILATLLRFYSLGSNPPSLYWDEASLGYNAYSILQTAKDEHGKLLPITNFAAFGDYKPPLYIYAAVPSIAVLGLTETAIRFPSAFFGVLTVLMTYFLAKKLFKDERIAQIASFFLAISPWHLQFSRGAFESNLAIFFSVTGIYFFIKFATDKGFYIFISALSFIAAMYTFTGQRLFVPLIVILLTIQFKKEIIKNFKIVLVSALFSFILFYPLLKFASYTIEGRLRFEEVTIFKDLSPIEKSIKFREADSFSNVSGIIHNRRFFFAREYLINYFDAFNPSFLFFHGDQNPRLSIQSIGHLYYFDLIFILAGIYFLFARKNSYRYFLIGWLLVSPLGPATARETPHALRMLHVLPVLQIISAYGLYHLFEKLRFKRIGAVTVAIVISLSVFYYLHMYYLHYPREFSGEWQYGYSEAVRISQEYYNQVDRIVVTKKLGRPYIFFLTYMKYDPKKYWTNSDVVTDEFFFVEVKRFDKYIFTDDVQKIESAGKTLYIVPPGGLPSGSNRISTVKDLGQAPVFDIGIKQ